MWRILKALLLTATYLCLTNGAHAQQPLEKFVIVHGSDGMQYFPLYIARGGGFFEREGIEVDWINVNSGTRQAAAVLGGSADMTPITFLQIIKAKQEGADLIAIATLFDVYAVSVTLSNEAIQTSGLKVEMPIDEKVKRLQGLNIGISSAGSSTDAFIRGLLLARGYDPDKVIRLQPFGAGASLLAAFEKKLIDGVAYVAPIPDIIEQRGLGKSVIDPFVGEVPELKDVPYVALGTTRETLAKKPDLVRRAMRAVTNALEFVQKNPEETCKIVRDYFPDLEGSIFKVVCETYRKAVPRQPVIVPEQVAKMAAWMSLGEKQKVTVKFEDVVDDHWAKETVTALKK